MPICLVICDQSREEPEGEGKRERERERERDGCDYECFPQKQKCLDSNRTTKYSKVIMLATAAVYNTGTVGVGKRLHYM